MTIVARKKSGHRFNPVAAFILAEFRAICRSQEIIYIVFRIKYFPIKAIVRNQSFVTVILKRSFCYIQFLSKFCICYETLAA